MAFIAVSIFDIVSNGYSVRTNTQYRLFLIWILIFAVSNIVSYALFSPSKSLSITLLGNFLYLVCAVDLFLKSKSVFKYLVISYLLGIIIVALSTVLGVSYQLEVFEELGSSRLYIFGMNPNGLSFMAVIAYSLAIYFLLFYRKTISSVNRIICILVVLSATFLILITGSKGGLLMFFASSAIIFFDYARNSKFAIISFIALLIIGFYAFMFFWNSDMYQERFSSADLLTGRGELFRRGIVLFEESPIWGWGEYGYEYRMKELFNESRACHNGFIDILALQGLLGFSFFITFLIGTLKQSSVILEKPVKYLIISFWVIFVLNFSKDGGVLNAKYTWIMFSILLAFSYQRVNSFMSLRE